MSYNLSFSSSRQQCAAHTSFSQFAHQRDPKLTRAAAFRGQFRALELSRVASQTSALHRSPLSLPQQYSGIMARAQRNDRQDAEDTERQGLLEDAAASGSALDLSNAPYDLWMTCLLFLFPALGGALFGYDIGATSGALVSLTSPTLSGTDWYNLSSFQSGVVVSCSLFGALGGSLAALVWGDKLGRKRELLLGATCYGSGSLLMSVSPSLGILLLGHTVYGVGIGFAMHAAPAYIAETAPAQVRGLLISLKEAFIVGGILLGYLLGSLFVEQVGGWRAMYGAAALPALVLAAGMFVVYVSCPPDVLTAAGPLSLWQAEAWLPESPRWLLLNGAGTSEAAKALARVKGKYAQDTQEMALELRLVQRALEEADGGGRKEQGYAALLQPSNLRPLLVGMSLMLFQQITGQPSVLYYAATIFQNAGFASASEATKISVILGSFKLLMTGIAVFTVDKVGRRPLLLIGVSGMVLSLGTLALSTGSIAAANAGTVDPVLSLVSVGALLLYVGCYQVSFGPISWLLVGEIFPLGVRSRALALATITNFGSNFLVSLVLPSVQAGFGLSGTYALFGGIGVLAVASIYSTVPETKGKTLEEIQQMWETGAGQAR